MRRYELQKSDLPPPGKYSTQPLLGSTHSLLHCPISKLTCLAPGNLEQNVQASRNYSSSGSLSSNDQACHNYNSSNSFGLYGQLSHNYSILVGHYNHPKVVLCIRCKVATARSFVELVYFPRTVLIDPGSLVYFSSYLLFEAFHHAHQTCRGYWASLSGTQTLCHFVDSLVPKVDSVIKLPSTYHQYLNSHSSQFPSKPCPVHIATGDQIVTHIQP